MKLDYHYFLKRRNITTHTIIQYNKITSYDEFIKLLKSLNVAGVSKEYFDKEYSLLYPSADKNVDNKVVSKENLNASNRGKASRKKTSAGKSPARGAAQKKRSKSKRGSGTISKDKPTTS